LLAVDGSQILTWASGALDRVMRPGTPAELDNYGLNIRMKVICRCRLAMLN